MEQNKQKIIKIIITFTVIILILAFVSFLIAKWIIDTNNAEKFKKAIYENDIKKVKELIEKGANINSKTDTGEIPIFMAIEQGRTTIVKLFLEKGANLKKKNTYYKKTPMEWAVWHSNQAIIRLIGEYQVIRSPEASKIRKLWERGIVYNVESFVQCAMENDKEAVKLFLAEGIDPNKKNNSNLTALDAAIITGHADMVSFLINESKKITKKTLGSALISASSAGNLDSLKFLIDKGADVNYQNEYGDTALMYSLTFPVLDHLLKSGAKVNLVNKAKQNALMKIILNNKINNKNCTEMVDAVVKKGVDLSAQSSTLRALARQYKRAEVEKILDIAEMDEEFTEEYYFERVLANDLKTVESLIEKGIYVDATNIQKETVLIIAVKKGYIEMISLLLSKGAFVNYRDYQGKTALYHATYSLSNGDMRDKIIDMLKKAGGKL